MEKMVICVSMRKISIMPAMHILARKISMLLIVPIQPLSDSNFVVNAILLYEFPIVLVHFISGTDPTISTASAVNDRTIYSDVSVSKNEKI